ncbi:MAG TPA: M1 family peptidase, partial [Ferruginibacter sp.]|nr:M1 family peptidase [Ferruginibacter sp.]
MKKLSAILLVLLSGLAAGAQDIKNNPGSNHGNRFEQLGTILPTPNEYRTASGAPGTKYWQQRCDYDIVCELDEPNRRLTGKETLTYYNNSPDVLTYLWLQLDENQHSNSNNSGYQSSNFMPRNISEADIVRFGGKLDKDREYGVNITRIADVSGKPLTYTINKTM